MAIEEKATVAIDNLSSEEACAIFKLFGFLADSAERLYGGYASSNFKMIGRRPSESESKPYLLKINYYGLTVEDVEYQLHIMSHCRKTNFPTNYPHATEDGKLFVESDGRRAMVLDFVTGGIPGQLVLSKDEAKAPKLLGDLSAALAQLHQIEWPAEPVLRDIRIGYPVCNTGDLLRGDEIRNLEADTNFSEHPVVVYARENIEWFRALYRRDVPWGVIHGDAFLDNTLYEDGPEGSADCRLLALIDWEDSCVGPYVLDLAVCASACCFTASNDLIEERLKILVNGYQARRPLSSKESESFADFMLAGAFACAFYRFGEFNVRKPDSDAQAKDSYRIMYDRAKKLEVGGSIRDVISRVLQPGGYIAG